VRWEIFPMFGKPTIGSNQQRRDSVALGFEPAIANPFDASRNPQSRELPHAKGDPYGSPAPISQESVVAGAGFERAKLNEPQGGKSASAPRADHPANAIVQDRALAWKSVVWCPGAGSNHRHCDFQSHALPTELPGHTREPKRPGERAVYREVGRLCPPSFGFGFAGRGPASYTSPNNWEISPIRRLRGRSPCRG
jgi:hypothetical protein